MQADEVRIGAPMSSTWFFQHLHQPCVQYDMGLGFLHDFLEDQNEQQEWVVEMAFDEGNRQGLAIPILRPSCYQ